jgi:hypothetical protein
MEFYGFSFREKLQRNLKPTFQKIVDGNRSAIQAFVAGGL